jgi:hypothetical protein
LVALKDSSLATLSGNRPSLRQIYRRFTSRAQRDPTSSGSAQMTVIETAEARKTPRRRVLDLGLIRFGDLSAGCVIRNLSATGAALDVGRQCLLPDSFRLIVVGQKKAYYCNMIWRKGSRVGVTLS